MAEGSTPRTGRIFETVFWRNQGEQKKTFPFRATHINGVKSDKVILCKDSSLPAGRTVRVKVTRVKRPQSKGRGLIEVQYLGPVAFVIDPDIYLDKSIAKKLQVLLEAGYSILLDGPQGTGKTVLSRTIAKALDMEYVYFNCASVYDATDFIATLQIRASESGVAETISVPTDICLALRRAENEPHVKFLIFLDELNRCRPIARNGLMPALDSTRKIFDPSTNSMVDIPENVQFCAAINTGDQFAGASAVDPAQMDRFATLKLDYPPAEDEIKLLTRRYPQVELDFVKQIVAAANAVRFSETLGVDLSVRATEEACVLLSHPFFSEEMESDAALLEVLQTAFGGRFPGRIDDLSSDAGLVWEIVTNALKTGATA